jgi:LysR family transcriptional regulator, glycine cleavage system transcriptional activator
VRRLPPFFALRALEAAARHRSYSRAADELSVTHGAVSQQIRRLEAELGARLFERRGNSMAPTPAAQRLAGEVGRGLDVLQNAVAQFNEAAERDPLVISLDPQFASRWLPTRLPKLLAEYGANLEIRVEERRADFTTDGVDIAVRYGAGRWQGVEAQPLFAETLFPVCSPGFAAEHPMRQARDLLTTPLLHHGYRPWSLWFHAFELKPPTRKGLLFEDSVMLLEAAAQGLGVALARSGLIERDLAAGRLVRPLPGAVASDLGFFVVWRGDSRKLSRISALRDWLIAEAAAAEQEAEAV